MTNSALQSAALAKRAAVLLLCVVISSSCASDSDLSANAIRKPQIHFGKSRQEIHNVSVIELLGRPSEFDGQPVRVIGVASFDFSFEGESAVYATAEDEQHLTNSFIRIGTLSSSLAAPSAELEKLTGKFIVIEGTFRARPLQRIPRVPGREVVCVGDCQTSGILDDVNRVSFWEF